MAMAFGESMKILHKCIKGIIVWIKNQVMEFISGRMNGFIKEISKMIYEMVLVSCMKVINLFIVDIGKMVNRQIKISR